MSSNIVMRVYKSSEVRTKLLNDLTPLRCGLKSFKRQLRQLHVSEELEYALHFITKMQATVAFLEKRVEEFRHGVDASLIPQKSTQFAKRLLKLRKYCAILEALVMDLSQIEDEDRCLNEMTYMQKTAKLNVRIQQLAKDCHMSYVLK